MSKVFGLLLVLVGLTAAYGFDQNVPYVEGTGYGPIPLSILPATVECTEEGFVADPDDRTVYYRCVATVNGEFEVFKFWCRDGRNWDQERQVCRYDSPIRSPLSKAAYAGNSANIECTEEGFVADPEDSTRYYRCIETSQGQFITFQFQCQDGRKWDQDRQTCRYGELIPQPLPEDSQ